MLPHTVTHKPFDAYNNHRRNLRVFMVVSGICAVSLVMVLRQHLNLKQQFAMLEFNFDKRASLITKLQDQLEMSSRSCETKSQEQEGRIAGLIGEKDQLIETLNEKETEMKDKIAAVQTELEETKTNLETDCSAKVESYSGKCNEKLQEQYGKIAEWQHSAETCNAQLTESRTELEQSQLKYKEALKIIKTLRAGKAEQLQQNIVA